ncbi:MAG: hypothetical protein IPK77_13920 [Cellvibrio sp.]|nr:hypothetical protein [Cellvibrio sp.]
MVAGKISAQLLKDIVAQVSKQGDKRIWIFADDSIEALKPEFASEIIKKIETDTTLQIHLAGKIGSVDRNAFLKEYLGEEEKLQDAIKALMGIF